MSGAAAAIHGPALVAYATKHGSTAEIAEVLGEALRTAGLTVDVRPVREVRALDPYGTVIVGSAVYMGRWQGDAIDFLQRFERDLRAHPTWLFSSGPTGGTPEADAKVAEATAMPEVVRPPADVASRSARIGARGHATFGGCVSDQMTGLLERWMPRGDWRDLDQVRAWATRIAAAA